MPIADVERLWCGLAEFFGVSPELFRADDLLGSDLAGLTGHIDYDPFLNSLILLHKSETVQALRSVQTWAELISSLYLCEQEQGRLGTSETCIDGETRVRWNS